MSEEDNRMNQNDDSQERFQKYQESIQQFLTFDLQNDLQQQLVHQGFGGLDAILDKITLSPLKIACRDALAPLEQEMNSLRMDDTADAAGLPMIRFALSRMFNQFETTYTAFPDNLKTTKPEYKRKHSEANYVFDLLHSQQENINIIKKFIDIDEYKKFETFSSISQATKTFIKNVIEWLEDEKYWLTTFGVGIVIKNAKDPRMSREAMLHFPSGLGNPLDWDMTRTNLYFACGSKAQNEAMGTTPTVASDLITQLCNKEYIITVKRIKEMIDISISGKHRAAIKEANRIGWKANGKGPKLKPQRMLFV